VTRMKPWTVLAVAACLSACAQRGPGDDLPDRSAAIVDGQRYDIGRLTDSTWTAISRPGSGTQPASAAHRTAVLQAIERASGCRVTDSDDPLEGRQFNAQVDCASRLKN